MGQRGRHILPSPCILLPHVFAHACAKSKKIKNYVSPPPHQLELFLGQSSIFSCIGAEEEDGEHAGRVVQEALTLLHSSSRVEQLAPAANPLL